PPSHFQHRPPSDDRHGRVGGNFKMSMEIGSETYFIKWLRNE
ncbi:16340_t:CDS:1, partial [Racocetra persica]